MFDEIETEFVERRVRDCGKDCIEVKKVMLSIDKLAMENDYKNKEHLDITSRIFKMESKFDELKTEVKKDIQSIKDEIPEIINHSFNKILAKLFLMLVGVVGIGLIISFTKPILLEGLKNLIARITGI